MAIKVEVEGLDLVSNPTELNKEEKLSAVAGQVMSTLRRYKDLRLDKEEIWTEAWAMYLGTHVALEHLRSMTLKTVGNVNNDWRHRISVGKAFAIVEDILARLMAALFPTEEWLDVETDEPAERQFVRILKKFYEKKLDLWGFTLAVDVWLRQAVICGVSHMAVPWSGTKQDFEVLDVFDVFFDPTVTEIEDSPFIRQHWMTRAQLVTMVKEGSVELSMEDILKYASADETDLTDDTQRLREFEGIRTEDSFHLDDKIRVYEYWGDIVVNNTQYTGMFIMIACGKVIKFEKSAFECGRPFVTVRYIPAARQPYGIGALQTSLGALHQIDILTNQRLDNGLISGNNMWTMLEDGILRPDDVYSEPGRVFPVSSHDALRPLDMPQNQTVSVQDQQILAQAVDMQTGTGSLVGSTPPRSGERVTAAEIAAVRDAGGSRLTYIFSRIEKEGIIPLLYKTLLNILQFTETKEVVQLVRPDNSAIDWWEVTVKDLRSVKHRLTVKTAQHIMSNEAYVNRRVAFVTMASGVPQMAELLNYEAILEDMLQKFGFENPERYMIQREQEQGKQVSPLEKMGGKNLRQGAIEAVAADGGKSMFAQMTGTTLPEGLGLSDVEQQYAGAEQFVSGLESQ